MKSTSNVIETVVFVFDWLGSSSCGVAPAVAYALFVALVLVGLWVGSLQVDFD